MDVNGVSFYPLIIDILDDISRAHFVAFDLELTGVPSKDFGTSSSAGKPSLQQRYSENKAAAERYQILQIGLTCVEQDVDTQEYLLKPYNFNISPAVKERLGLDRVFSCQADTLNFLLEQGHDLNQCFKHGVPYLSRVESKLAREKHAKSLDKSDIPFIEIKSTETQSLAFMDRTRDAIKSWLAEHRIDPLIIGSIGTDDGALSRFEKRLVHQLVRYEFSDLVSVSGGVSCVRIMSYDKDRENKIHSEKKRELDERINRQKGFRWIIEALHGGNVLGFNFREVAKSSFTGDDVFSDTDLYKGKLYRIQEKIRGNPRVLVGHNCFLDLVFIYKAFIGDLPDTVEAFQARLHELWPTVVDTKYMSTHGCGDISPASSLKSIAEQLKSETVPNVETDELHSNYVGLEALHQAGYDSYLTAQIAIKLSSKLRREAAVIEQILTPSKAATLKRIIEDMKKADLNVDTKGTDNNDLEISGEIEEQSTMPKSAVEQMQANIPADATDGTNGFTPSIPGSHWRNSGGDPSLGPLPPGDPFHQRSTSRKSRWKDPYADLEFEGGMPRWSDEFWRTYGNKMRVFGTEESVLLLDPPIVSSDSEAGGVKV